MAEIDWVKKFDEQFPMLRAEECGVKKFIRENMEPKKKLSKVKRIKKSRG